ncbi:MAG: squalene synthase HpnC [Rhodoferax sp.]
MSEPVSTTAAPITHYENFPVASWLCPPHLRAPIAAIYHFARTADDLADEGDTSADERLAALQAYRTSLDAAAQGHWTAVDTRWAQVFGPLAQAIAQFQLPLPLLHALLDAFAQDVRATRDGLRYPDHAALLDYCSRSANPVGRLLLHLYGVCDTLALQRSDAICSALQLINFWQDLSVDIARQRYYLPLDVCARFGYPQGAMQAQQETPNAIELIAHLCQLARARMEFGQALVHQLPGRAGWELRLVVAGGLCILDKIAAIGHRSLRVRVRLRAWDVPRLLWRALRM